SHQFNSLRQSVNMNPNRDTLREPHPAKGWLDIRQAKPPGLVIVIIYSASDTLNMTRDHRLKSHQRNVCRALLNKSNFC
ncbi:hypothetical protein JTM45_32915, partial [Pseudomonas aeruginosa]|nr:hypothetical protein [Pseudomonas aeruginosa]